MTSTCSTVRPAAPASRLLEFRCPACGSLLRTRPRNSGRPGRCPACRMIVQIPRRHLWREHFLREPEPQTHSC
jgi:predicted RNA-binding Zn-ribbon protein involved in translation (DUF1610 family)